MFSVFLFLLLFKLNYSAFGIKVFQLMNQGDITEISYHDETILNEKNTYIFILESATDISILYWMGAQLMRNMRMQTAYAVGAIINKIHIDLPEINVHIIRETSNTEINKFKELLSTDAKKTPRLYKIAGAHLIHQIPLNCDMLNEEDSFILDDEESVTACYVVGDQMKTDITNSLIGYIVEVENGEERNSFPNKGENSNAVRTPLQEFCDEILNAQQVHSKKKADSISKSNMKNSKGAKKIYKKNIAAILSDTEFFENKKKEIFEHLKNNMILTETDSHRARILSTTTASSSAGPTNTYKGKKSKSAKGKNTTSKVTKKVSFLESVFGRESTNVFTTSTAQHPGNNQYNLIPIFMGSEKCAPRTQPPLINTLNSMCTYVLKDLISNELFIYIAKNSKAEDVKAAFVAVEIDVDENPLVTVTIIHEGNIIPTPFMLQIESEVRKLLPK